MYQPAYLFDRTPEEKRDMFKSWARTDQAFFASGACHILAELFVQLHQHEGFMFVQLKPTSGFPGNHVIASDGTWAFDHNGWTKEVELLGTIEKAYAERYSGWNYQKNIIKQTNASLEEFCTANNHRKPWQYAYLPWERAYDYIAQFPEKPPED